MWLYTFIKAEPRRAMWSHTFTKVQLQRPFSRIHIKRPPARFTPGSHLHTRRTPIPGTKSAYQGDCVPRRTLTPWDEARIPRRLRTKVDPNPWDEVCIPKRLRTKVDPNPWDEVRIPRKLRTKVDPNAWDEVCIPRRLRSKENSNPMGRSPHTKATAYQGGP